MSQSHRSVPTDRNLNQGQGLRSARPPSTFHKSVWVVHPSGEIRIPSPSLNLPSSGSNVYRRFYNEFEELSPSRRDISGKVCGVLSLTLMVLALGGILILGLTSAGGGGQSNIASIKVNKPNGPNDGVTTAEWKEAVTRVRSSMNETVDPCQDFHQYACGGWIQYQSTKLRSEMMNKDTSIQELTELDKDNVQRITKLIVIDALNFPYPIRFHTIEYKIKQFHNSCMSQEKLLLIWSILTQPENSTRTQGSLNKTTIPEFVEEENEIKEWMDILQELHPHPDSLPGYLKFFLGSNDKAKIRSTICSYFAREFIPEGVARLFVTSHYLDDPSRDKGVKELITKLRTTMLKMISESTWITDWESGQNIARRIADIYIISGYLPHIFNATFVDGLYANVTISDDFFSNLKELMTVKNNRKMNSGLFGQLDLAMYEDTAKANAYYMQLLNAIYIPAGIVQIPTFHPSFPEVIKFAKLGTTMAHELSHSLNAYIEGVTLEIEGLKTPIVIRPSIVTTRTRDNFRGRRQCLVEQYNDFEVPLPVKGVNVTTPSFKVNGTQTVKENIADVLGFRIAFKSFMENDGDYFQPIPGLSEKFSKEQIFFIASAQGLCHAYRDDETEVKLLREQVATDVHSPNAVRVLGALQNCGEFSKAFNCPLGSRYNPVQKCAAFNS